MSAELELDQKLADLAEQMQAATLELGQRLAEAMELLAERKEDARIEQLLSSVSDNLSAVLRQDSSHKIAEAIIAGIKGLKIQAPDVKVEIAAPQVHVKPTVINVEPTPIQMSHTIEVPQQAAPNVIIEGAKEWRLGGVQYDRLGRITDASLKRVS